MILNPARYIMANVIISGKMCSGKTTLAKQFESAGYTILSFAQPLKELLELMTYPPLDREPLIHEYCVHLFGEDMGFDITRWIIADILCPGAPLRVKGKDDAGRAILQKLGHGGRQKFGYDIWVKAAETQLHRNPKNRWVIDDARYPNELSWAKEHGFTSIRLEVPEDVRRERIKLLYGDVSEDRINHVTETLLDNYEFDITHRWEGESPREVYERVVRYIDFCAEKGSGSHQ